MNHLEGFVDHALLEGFVDHALTVAAKNTRFQKLAHPPPQQDDGMVIDLLLQV